MNQRHHLQPGTTAHTLILQHCDRCREIQYPPREVCKNCLSDELSWKPIDNRGVLLARSDLHTSLEPRHHLPWQLASVQLDCGVRILAHNRAGCGPGESVRILAKKDQQGKLLLVVTATDKEENP